MYVKFHVIINITDIKISIKLGVPIIYVNYTFVIGGISRNYDWTFIICLMKWLLMIEIASTVTLHFGNGFMMLVEKIRNEIA